MSWCGVEDFTSVNCLTSAVVLPVIDVLFATLFTVKIAKAAKVSAFASEPQSSFYYRALLQYGSLLQAAAFAIYFVDGDNPPSEVLMVLLQMITWFYCAFLIYFEALRLLSWPSLLVKAFMLLNLICTMLIVTSDYTGDHATTIDVLQACGICIVNIILLVTLVVKELIIGMDDISRDDLLMDFREGNYPIRASKDSYIFQKLNSADNDSEQYSKNYDERGRCSNLCSSIICCGVCCTTDNRQDPRVPTGFVNSQESSTQYPSALESAIERNSIQPMQQPNPNSQQSLHARVSSQWSAFLTGRRRDNNSFSSPYKFSTPNKSTDSYYNNQTHEQLKTDIFGSLQNDASYRESNTNNDSTHPDHSIRQDTFHHSYNNRWESGDDPNNNERTNLTSRALSHVLVGHKNKLANANPILEPRYAVNDTRNHSTESGYGLGGAANCLMGNRAFYCQVLVQRWGMRRNRSASNYDVVIDNNSSNGDPRTGSRAISRDSNISNDKSPRNHSNTITSATYTDNNTHVIATTRTASRDSNKPTTTIHDGTSTQAVEVEFEVTVRANLMLENNVERSNSSGLNVSPGSDASYSFSPEAVGGSKKPIGGGSRLQSLSGTKFWTVWRTTSEIAALHSSMVSVFGDLTPRRPRLRSVLKVASELTTQEFQSDMRSVSVYINALIKGHDLATALPLMQFLEIEAHLGPVTLSTFSINESLLQNDDNTAFTTANQLPNSRSTDFGDYNVIWGTKPNRTSQQFQDINPFQQAEATMQLQHEPSSSGVLGGGSTFDAAEYAAAAQNTQEKWRKLFLNMRVKLKPHDIGIRCRLFEGVISGGEVAGWLIRPPDNSDELQQQQQQQQLHYQHAKDTFEACAIGQELLRCGLLEPVAWGFDKVDEVDDDRELDEADAPMRLDVLLDGVDHPTSSLAEGLATPPRKTSALHSSGKDRNNPPSTPNTTRGQYADTPDSSHRILSQSHSTNNNNNNQNPNSSSTATNDSGKFEFSDKHGYVYRFHAKSTTTRLMCSLFGAPIKVRVPLLTTSDEVEESRPSREPVTLNAVGMNTTLAPAAGALSLVASGGHVMYLVEISHGGDQWQVWKRYREFEQVHRSLVKEGVRCDVPLPAKTFGNTFSRLNRAEMLENRRLGLEQYLEAMAISVISSQIASALELFARFLDDDYDHLRLDLNVREHMLSAMSAAGGAES